MPGILTSSSSSPAAVSDIAIRVKRIFGDESGAQIDDDDILRWANDAQLDIARKTHCIVKTEYYNTSVDGYELSPPSGFLFFLRATCDGRMLSPLSYQELDVRYPHRLEEYPAATPEYIVFLGSSLQLYPAPDTAGSDNLIITYIARPAALVNLGDVLEIPDQYYEAVVTFCLMRAKELDQDWAASGIYQQRYEDELINIKTDQHQPAQADYPVVRDYDGDY